MHAAELAGVPVADYVREKAARFAALRGPLQLSFDDFIQTSVDPRHEPGVHRLWRACAAACDLYQKQYQGLYCTGCEAFLTDQELVDGLCPEHHSHPERVSERNWFFRLSRYQQAILDLIESSELRIVPDHRRNEVLSFLSSGLSDISVSRSVDRARGWGIRVPDDRSQVIYVWFDALGNYITAPGYGNDGDLYRTWWRESQQRLHIVGKGVIRFHAVYWPAFLLSAGEPLPTAIFVHDYLTFGGGKLSKSAGASADPVKLADRYGADALRWWFLRDVPRAGDTDFREELVAARGDELANEIGNLINRVITLINRARPNGLTPVDTPSASSTALRAAAQTLTARIDTVLGEFDFRAASGAITELAAHANRFVSTTRPWELAQRELDNDHAPSGELDAILGALLDTCRVLSSELSPFLPAAARRIHHALATQDTREARQLFAKAPQT